MNVGKHSIIEYDRPSDAHHFAASTSYVGHVNTLAVVLSLNCVTLGSRIEKLKFQFAHTLKKDKIYQR